MEITVENTRTELSIVKRCIPNVIQKSVIISCALNSPDKRIANISVSFYIHVIPKVVQKVGF